SGSGMRRIQFTDHLVYYVKQLLAIPYVLDQGLILGASCVPVLAVHCRIVEPVLHRPPGVIKHLCPLSGLIDFHFHLEQEPACRTLCASCSSGRCGASLASASASRSPAFTASASSRNPHSHA